VNGGPFRLDVDVSALQIAAAQANRLASALSEVSRGIGAVPGGLGREDWSGRARDAVVGEMEGLARASGTAGEHFETAGRVLSELFEEVRDAVEAELPSLNRRWEAAVDRQEVAVSLARGLYGQKASALPVALASSDRQEALTDPARTRDRACQAAGQALAGEQARLEGEYEDLVATLERAFTRAGHVLQGATMTGVDSSVVSHFTAAGGTGTMSAWCSPDGGVFPPGDLGALDALKGDLALVWYREGEQHAAQAVELAQALDHGDAPQVEQLKDLVTQYADNPAFASTFLNGLGAGGLLHLTTATAQGRGGQTLTALHQALGQTLACGTQNPGQTWQVSPGWVKDLTGRGREHWSFQPHPTVEEWTSRGRRDLSNFDYQVYGYQALGVLLRSGTYSAGFLNTVGGDLLAFERTGLNGDGADAWPHQAWDHAAVPLIPGGDTDTWDPAVGLLAAVGRDSDVARAFFTGEKTPEEDSGWDRLNRVDYLVTDRDWGGEDLGVHMLGIALRAATVPATGEESLSIVNSLVHEISCDERNTHVEIARQDLINPLLRPYLAEALATHLTEIHRGFGMLYKNEANAYDKNIYLADTQTADRRLDATDLIRVLVDLGKDPEARNTLVLHESDFTAKRYVTALVDGVTQLAQQKVENDSRMIGQVFGALDLGRSYAIENDLGAENGRTGDAIENSKNFTTLAVNMAITAGTMGASPLVLAIGELGKGLTGTLHDQITDPGKTDHAGLAGYNTALAMGESRETLEGFLEQALIISATAEAEAGQERLGFRGVNGELLPQSAWGDRENKAWEQYELRNQVGISNLQGAIHDAYGSGVSDARKGAR
jgi:hypothetical protein